MSCRCHYGSGHGVGSTHVVYNSRLIYSSRAYGGMRVDSRRAACPPPRKGFGGGYERRRRCQQFKKREIRSGYDKYVGYMERTMRLIVP